MVKELTLIAASLIESGTELVFNERGTATPYVVEQHEKQGLYNGRLYTVKCVHPQYNGKILNNVIIDVETSEGVKGLTYPFFKLPE